MAFCQYDGHEDAFVSLSDIDGTKLQKCTEAIRQAIKDGVEPWGLSKEVIEELEETAARKKAERHLPRRVQPCLWGELEQGLDENAE